MNFWFSVPEDMLLDEDFIKSKPSEKLYYFALLHYLNLYEISYDGRFFKRDMDFAAALSYSEDSIRDARRKFKKLGWIDFASGFRTKHGQNVATTYHYVKWKEIPKINEGKRFVKFPHYDFEMMLEQLYHKCISHQDMVVYCYIVCWEQLNGMIGRPFYFPKKELRKYTNIIKAVDCVKNLASVPVFGEKAVLDCKDDYHRLFITLRRAADPYEDENNREMFNLYLERRGNRARELLKAKRDKEIQKAKEKGLIMDPSQLLELFETLYKETHGKNAQIFAGQEEELIELGNKYGVESMAFAIREYFYRDDKEIPNPTNTKYKNLTRFLRVYDIFLGSLSGNK
ncbi:hypothetical protein [Bacillus smithii]|uniref:hypothetical protein n=1 Tax=Bacillus smithii TaxID=1479 RepID=UPI002E208906|nr:hypothetical protein [Bacillus smithii]